MAGIDDVQVPSSLRPSARIQMPLLLADLVENPHPAHTDGPGRSRESNHFQARGGSHTGVAEDLGPVWASARRWRLQDRA